MKGMFFSFILLSFAHVLIISNQNGFGTLPDKKHVLNKLLMVIILTPAGTSRENNVIRSLLRIYDSKLIEKYYAYNTLGS